MKKDPRVRVGIVLTLFIGLLFALVFSLDSAASWWRGSNSLRVVFTDVQGIRPSDPVHVHGVASGRVRSVEFEDARVLYQSGVAFAATEDGSDDVPEGCRVVLTLDLPEKAYQLLRTGAEATIDKTLTGVTVVNLLQGDGDPLPADATIVGTQRATIQEITDELHRSSLVVSQILQGIDQVVSRCKDEDLVGGALGSLRDAAQEGKELVQKLEDLIEENRENIAGTTLGASELVGQWNESSERLPEVLSRLERLTGEASDWLVGARPRLDAITEDVASSTENLKALSSDLRHRPWRLLHSPTEEEAKALELYESATQYSQGSVELRRSIDRLAQLLSWVEQDDVVYPAVLESLESLKTRLERHKAFEQSLWRRLEGLEE